MARTDPALIVFDFDGVVVDSEVISLATAQEAMADYGLPLDLDTIRERYLGVASTRIEADVAAHSPRGHADGFKQHWNDRLYERFRADLGVMPGIHDLLDRIAARGMRHCIASSGSLERLGVALEATGLRPRFDHVFSAEQVTHGKPAPDLFLLAAGELGVTPENCLVIEDSPYGIRAAIAAGMPSVGFVGGTHLDGLRETHGRMLSDKGAGLIAQSLDAILPAPRNADAP